MQTYFDDISLAAAPSCTIEDAVLYLMGSSQQEVKFKQWKTIDDPSGGEFLRIKSYQDFVEEWEEAKFAFEEAEKYRDSQIIKARKLAELTQTANENAKKANNITAEELLKLSSMSIQKSKSLNKAVKEKQAELDEYTKKYELACFYKSAIIVEYNAKESSLIKDETATQDEKDPYIFLYTIKDWASKKFNISILNDLKPENINFPSTNSFVEPLKLSRQQEIAVLDEIKKLGYDPKSLPKLVRGMRSTKAQIKKNLINHILFKDKTTVFKHTWERLSEEEIAYLK